MKSFTLFTRLFSLAFILAAAGLVALHAAQPPREEAVLAHGTVIAGIPVGGLEELEARTRIETAYATPVELVYRQDRILAHPHELGFTLQLDAMVEQARQPGERWRFARFWSSLWNIPPAQGANIPLQSKIDTGQIRRFLENEIVPRYDLPAHPPYAV
ncbi:MAG TPA: hypothetical protein VLH85_01390, partial [Levilinea sp.]|nr:hypothetical protein [Levilinea sp.]